MPTNADRPVLVDTSVALALLLDGHILHDRAHAALAGARLGLAGHASFETYSVLTRMPPPDRMGRQDAARAIAAAFPATVHLDAARSASLLASLPDLGIAGGSIYDALVAAAAAAHDLELVSADRRALGTYHALDVRVRFLDA